MSHPLLQFPSTPSSSQPTCPEISPYASFTPATPNSSPLVAAETRRRRAQYKSRTPSTPIPSRRTSLPSRLTPAPTDTSSTPRTYLSFTPAAPTHYHPRSAPHGQRRTPSTDSPQKAFLRERFIARCLERVRKDRERAVHARRRSRSRSSEGPSEGSSDGPDDAYMDDADTDADEDESDEAVMQDEVGFSFCLVGVSPSYSTTSPAVSPDHAKRGAQEATQLSRLVRYRGWILGGPRHGGRCRVGRRVAPYVICPYLPRAPPRGLATNQQ